MRKLFLLAFGLFTVSLLIFANLEGIGDYLNVKPVAGKLHEIYEKKLQTPIFTGFITLGSFLLTLKTFIIVKLKESLYDSDAYKDTLRKQRLLKPNLLQYAPLHDLARFLIYIVILALVTAGSQMTVGFLPFNIAAAFCLSLAITTLFLVLVAWWYIKANLSDLFGIWEKQSRIAELATPPAPRTSASN